MTRAGIIIMLSHSPRHSGMARIRGFILRPGRRWVRLRRKRSEKHDSGCPDFDKVHMLNEDYFTIHSSRVRSRERGPIDGSRVESGILNHTGTDVREHELIEEIADIPSLRYAVKLIGRESMH